MELTTLQEKIKPVLQRADIQYAGVFGSIARGQATPKSDIDILVKFNGYPTFSRYLQLDQELREVLNIDIDLITEGGVNKFLRPEIERDLKLVYGQR
ncbi:nucleotidyltransferase family protein [Candidatus Uhrbacteria bacterium]|nr:nucleotidyltransferase family protein [Candidatus Uhrbacteria bacterium]